MKRAKQKMAEKTFRSSEGRGEGLGGGKGRRGRAKKERKQLSTEEKSNR
jgi:hypothetical protein